MNRKQLPVEVKKMIAGRVASGKWTLERAAETVGYSQSSVRRWKNRYANGAGLTPVSEEPDTLDEEPSAQTVPEGPKQERRELNEEVLAHLEAVMDKQPHLGRRGLGDWMKRHHQVKLSERQLARFLEESGRARPPVPVKPEVPPRRFEADRPLDMIQMDLWYVPRPGKGLYFYGLSTIEDHSRLCLSERVLEEQTAETVIEDLAATVARWGRPKKVLTDRGPQFWSWKGRSKFTAYVEEELKAEHIVAAARHPQTLGKTERFHRTLREEARLPEKGFPTRAEAQETLDRYVAWYNYVRPHQGIGGVTPADRFYGMARAVQAGVTEKWRPEQGLYLAANLGGRRLVLAGEGPETLRVLWDDAMLEVTPT